MSPEDQQDLISEYVWVVAEVQCSSCGKASFDEGGDYNLSAGEFYGQGWRATQQNIYCPKCAQKKLKNPD